MAEPGATPRRHSGELEAAVLNVLWTAGASMTPADVQRAVGTDLARSTVATVLARLHGKGSVVRGRVGRAYSYTPKHDAAGLAAARMHDELDKRGPDRHAVLAGFVSRLSRGDEALLRRLLDVEDATSDDTGPSGMAPGTARS
ncbi:Predicted transcriptional regulator [Streptomyces sp. DvalAA-14]|uniref:BlaI/MecI/CopY family transcriptional regulator n=1 Tax=unclassified Streptomyces TaxID=2593676 RepID=UPI00081B4E8E|nr:MULTISPECIES: BlaI/MecI/CopY family transcriptional regulator [unclassified Streptomyces]MYS21690.1 BlaI/MecI/CopY family transcriptional regulator [Streptomyces sp. SID4948]SCD98986.1 Predicted transcriptional regulator [Streptomyces sp. DvalAA-14]